jgi:tripartite-type tricarboxylate transporter receptor subunit TctC
VKKIIAVALCMLTASALAQEFPKRPVRMVVPLAPGGGGDIVARLLAAPLSEKWGQAVVVDNRPGAGGTVGNALVARAHPDGHVMLTTTSTLAISPALFTTSTIDVEKDLQPVSMVASQASIVVVNSAQNIKTLTDLVLRIRSQQGQIRFGSAGVGTASHLANELFLLRSKTQALHIPYRSAGQSTQALLSNEIQFSVTNAATAIPYISSGRLTGLAVTSTSRSKSLPQIPTVRESGVDYEYSTWYGVLVPSRVHSRIVTILHQDIKAVLGVAVVRDGFEKLGLDIHASEPQVFSEFLKREIAQWRSVVKAVAIDPQ